MVPGAHADNAFQMTKSRGAIRDDGSRAPSDDDSEEGDDRARQFRRPAPVRSVSQD